MSFVRLSCMVQELWAIFADWLQIDTQCDYKAHSESISFLSVDFLRVVQCFFFFFFFSFFFFFFFFRFIEICIKTSCTLHEMRMIRVSNLTLNLNYNIHLIQ